MSTRAVMYVVTSSLTVEHVVTDELTARMDANAPEGKRYVYNPAIDDTELVAIANLFANTDLALAEIHKRKTAATPRPAMKRVQAIYTCLGRQRMHSLDPAKRYRVRLDGAGYLEATTTEVPMYFDAGAPRSEPAEWAVVEGDLAEGVVVSGAARIACIVTAFPLRGSADLYLEEIR